MARANRHYISGYVWHITHRCHKKEFLLKFVRDRRRWIDWLFEAKKRFNLSVLNYSVTLNHIHLLVYDNNARDVIPKSMQLIAARTAQEYNIRKQRKGKERSLLGRSLSCYSYRAKFPFKSLSRLYRFEYG
jgi:REP element-mobilizing transposase RayT